MSEEKSKKVGVTEHEDEARDPESMKLRRTGTSWSSTWSTLVGSPDTDNEAIRSKSHGKWLSKWWWSSPKIPAEERILRPFQVSTAQDRFIVALLGALPSAELQRAYEWYINFLECKIIEAWETLFSQVLRDIGNCAKYPGADALSKAFQMLEMVVIELAREHLALTDVVDQLYNKSILRYTDSERSHANQLLFASIGWISCLYTADLNPAPRKLQIIEPLEGSSSVARRSSVRRRFQRDKVKVLTNYDQSLENSDKPLHKMLNAFGNIIPRRKKEFFSEQKPPLPVKPEDEWIELSLLCFHTMTKFSGVKIEWVDSLCLHLEFDSYTKVLKLFRLPSICLLMCCCEKMSPLSQLFSDSAESNDYLPIEVEDACHFYREVLLTYRLIFGQHKSSYKEFGIATRKRFLLPEKYTDPLLPLLCGQSCESPDACQIYALIEAEEPAIRYDPLGEFPFFGKRMLVIQRYVRAHHPSMPYANWQNKSSTSATWTDWFRNTATIFGVLTLLLAISQTILGILQVIYTKEQLP